MDVTIDQPALHRALRLTARIAPAKPVLPILQHVLLEASPGRLTLTASDLDVGVTTSVAADVAAPARTAARARLLDEYVAALPGEPVRLHLEDSAGRLRATCGRYRATFPIADPEEFPAVPAYEDADARDVDPDTLRTGIERVAFAAARDDARPTLKGLHCQFAADGLTLTACDGFRLARSRVAGVAGVPGVAGAPGAGSDAILPARAATEFGRLLAGASAARLAISGGRCMHLVAGDTVLFARLLEGPFPDVERVIPTGWRTRIGVETALLRRAVDVAGLFWSDAGGRPLRLEAALEGLRLHAEGVEAGDARAELSATVEGDAQTVSLGTPYLMEILAAVHSEQVELALGAPLTPLVVREAGQDERSDLWVLMPMTSVERSSPTSPASAAAPRFSPPPAPPVSAAAAGQTAAPAAAAPTTHAA